MTPATAKRILNARWALIQFKVGDDPSPTYMAIHFAHEALAKETLTEDIAVARERTAASASAFSCGDRAEAWHQLYSIANPNFEKTDENPWAELERIAASE